MELKNTTNFIISEEDTASTQGSFYILPHASYVRMGEAEQIINDSMALMISNKLQRMMLYTDAQPVWMQMKVPAGLAWQDSSAVQMAARYTIQFQRGESKQDVYIITDKHLLQGTTLPRESMRIQLEDGTHRPLAMHAIKRTLVPLSATDYASIRQNTSLAGKLVNKDDKEYYLVRELETSFMYKTFSHDAAIKIPVAITDRVRRDSEGAFNRQRAYKNFMLTLHE